MFLIHLIRSDRRRGGGEVSAGVATCGATEERPQQEGE